MHLKPNTHPFVAPYPSQTGVEEFKALYCEQFGTELSDQEALKGAIHLLAIVHFGLTPMPDYLKRQE